MVQPSMTQETETQTVVMTSDDVARTLKRLTHQLLEANRGSADLVLIGLVTRGVYLAERIAALIQQFEQKTVPVGALDVTLYRDDIAKSTRPITESRIPVDITGKHIILVDDVIFKGRTIRAALDALNAYGRPASVQLLVLLDRGHRELPISPNFVGKNLPTHLEEERVTLLISEVDGQDAVILQKKELA